MEYRNLGNSGLKVSEIGLGCNNFGGSETYAIDEQASVSVIHHAMDIGVNYIDTANWYGDQGQSEEFVGKGIKGKRSQVIIATKFGFAMSDSINDQGGSRYHIMNSVEASLKRLNTDYIDLYQMHRPDPTTPIEETLRALDDLVQAGKVRYIGCSNFEAWQLSEAIWTSRVNNLNHFITIQSRYSLLDRSIEKNIVPCCQTHGIGVIPWGPLAGGLLTGKYRKGVEAPKGSRFAGPAPIRPYRDLLSDANLDKAAKLIAFAAEYGHSGVELAISWLLSHSWISTVITGATKPKQVSKNVNAAEWKLTASEIARVEELT